MTIKQSAFYWRSKIRLSNILSFIFLLWGASASAALVNPNGTNTVNNDDLRAAEIAIAKQFKLIDGLWEFDNSDDYVFVMPQIFYNYFIIINL